MSILTLTLLDGAKGALEILPDTDPASGVVTVTARPSRHERALTQTLLGGYGVESSISGAGRSEAEDWRYLLARVRAYETRVLVIRHATFMHNEMLAKAWTFCATHDVDLALTCDESVGADLGAWVVDHGGDCYEGPAWLRAGLAAVGRAVTQVSATADDFPAHVPDGDFYVFRARCRDLLAPAEFARVDRLYADTGRAVKNEPFRAEAEAADWIRARHDTTPGPGQMKTIIRAAQAAMFTHGMLLKVDLGTVLAGVSDGAYRRLNAADTRRLRAYRQTWRSVVRVLRDADLSVTEMRHLRLGDVVTGLSDRFSLGDDARVIVATHREYRRLEGATDRDRLITESERICVTAIRQASVDLALPNVPNNERRDTSTSRSWRRQSGLTLIPITGPIKAARP